MGDIFKLLFKEKPALILLSLLNNNTQQYPLMLSKNINCTYCHVINTLQYLKNYKLIEFKNFLTLLELSSKCITNCFFISCFSIFWLNLKVE